MYTVLILEDDPLAAQLLKTIIELNFKKYCREFLTADSIVSARKILLDVTPDILFLDVKLQNELGFDLLKSDLDKSIEVVVVSGSESHAIEAIRHNVFDYLIKPVKPAELERVFQRVYLKRFQKQEAVSSSSVVLDKINISTTEGIIPVAVSEISFVEADNLYSRIILTDQSEIRSNKPLKHVEELLEGGRFMRIQKSYLINLNHIEKINKSNGGLVLMKGSALEIPISKHIRKEFYDRLKI